MAKPDKPVFIPERRVDRDVNKAPEFNHNIMGRRVKERRRKYPSQVPA